MNRLREKSDTFVTLAADIDAARWPALLRHGAAILIVGGLSILRAQLPLESVPFTLYMPGMFLIGFFLGRGPGALATVLSAFVVAYLFMSRGDLLLLSLDQVTGILSYVLVSIGLIVVGDLLRRTLARRQADLLEMSVANQALVAIREDRTRLALLIEQSTDFVAMANPEGHTTFLNDAARRMLGLSAAQAKDTSLVDYFAPQDKDIVAKVAMPAAAAAGKWEGELNVRNFMTGDAIPVLFNIFPIRDPMGALLGYGTVTKDITAQKRAEAQQSLLNHELGHRLKNTLAMIQAIANQTLRRAGSLQEARAAFDARLVALGKAQDVLTGARWESAEIGDVVRSALAPHGPDQGRFDVDGPRLMLSARCALALSLALHELATNATKYGALSNESGRVRISWRREEEENGAGRFHFTWRESGGPPVLPPQRSGFGSFMIERSLSGYFKGSARIAYDPEGVSFHLEGPITGDETEFLEGEAEILLPRVNFKGS